MATTAALGVNQVVTLDEITHIIQRSGMFIGQRSRGLRKAYLFDASKGQMVKQEVDHPPAQQHLFLEVVGNAGDNAERSRDAKIDPGEIQIQMNEEWVVVQNTGMYIEIAKHPQDGKWLPEKIFGNLRTGSNFNDADPNKSKTIGTNGYGVKLVNIFSKAFQVTCTDPERKLIYKQTWASNMRQCSEPIIEPYEGPAFTRVSYQLDFSLFDATKFEPVAFGLYMANAAQLACAKKVQVRFNNHVFNFKDLTDYAKLFFPINKKNAIVHAFSSPEGNYDICICDTPDKSITQSFVNGIVTPNDGAHVDAVYHIVVDYLLSSLEKHLDGIKITKKDVTNHISIFISCGLPFPDWGAQTKDNLKKLSTQKGSKFKIEIPTKLLKKIEDWELTRIILLDIQRKQATKLKQKGGKRTKKLDIKSLDDALWACGPNFRETTLALTEGDSGSTYSQKLRDLMPNGCERFGILPLQGKILNVLNAKPSQMIGSAELEEITKSLGLKYEMDYRDPKAFKTLRYGSVLLMPDADEDGVHILGLLLLYFILKFPSLIEIGYVRFMRTPVVLVDYHGQKFKFYTLSHFRKWISILPPDIKFAHEDINYFKGLGTFEDHQIADDYLDMKISTFQLDAQAQERIALAFHKDAADHRKAWITNWVEQEVLGIENVKIIPITHFVDQELIHYSFENVIRAIPEAMDGMKDSQRKAFYSLLKKLRKRGNTGKLLPGGEKAPKIKLEQVANYAAGATNYKHGANSLSDAIFKMFRHFVGSNNLPLVKARSQSGTRKKGGKDAPASRYAYAGLPEWTNLMFRKEDELILKQVMDDGEACEYENFYPILPPHVLNGIKGVGTAWSTNIPAHNPMDVAFFIQQMLLQILNPDKTFELPHIQPWYKGFTGAIFPDKNGFTCHGKFTILPNGQVHITELPIGRWTKKYEQMLDEMEEAKIIEGYENRSKTDTINFIITKFLDGKPTMTKLRLVKKISYSNLTVLYRDKNREIRPRIYNSIIDLLKDFVALRVGKYEERKNAQIEAYKQKILDLTERARFILLVVEKKIKILKRDEEEVYRDMDAQQLDRKWYGKVRANEFSNEHWLKLQEQIKQKHAEMEAYALIPSPQMWYDEIEEFVQYYCKAEKVSRSTLESCRPIIPNLPEE